MFCWAAASFPSTFRSFQKRKTTTPGPWRGGAPAPLPCLRGMFLLLAVKSPTQHASRSKARLREQQQRARQRTSIRLKPDRLQPQISLFQKSKFERILQGAFKRLAGQSESMTLKQAGEIMKLREERGVGGWIAAKEPQVSRLRKPDGTK